MYEQYPKFLVDSRAARRQLALMFASTVDWETKHRFTPVSARTLAAAQENHAGIHQTFPRDLVRSIKSFVHRIRIRTLPNQPGTGKRDVTVFGFMLVLVFLPA